MTRRAATAMLLLALGAGASAAPPDNAKEAAWFAHRAGEAGDAAAVPDLVALLDRKFAEHEFIVHEAALGALVRLDARVPASVLAKHAEPEPTTPALILIARDPEPHRNLLLGLFDRWSEGGYLRVNAVAVGNLLGAMRAPGFADRCLRRLEVRLDIAVIDWSGGIGGGGVGGAGGFRVTSGAPPAGFPPRPFYELTLGAPEAGFTVLADGPRPVRYRRLVGRTTGGRRVNSQKLVREWLALLAGTTAQALDLPVRRQVCIRWESDRQLLDEVEKQRVAIQQRYWTLVRSLVSTGALEEHMASPRITVDIRDMRRARPSPLPALPPSAVDVAWTAYEAGRKGDTPAAPALIDLLYRRDGPHEDLVRRAVLDALIRLDVKVDAEHLLPDLDGETRDLALILLAREPRKNRDLLLRLFDAWMPDLAPEGEETWIAIRLEAVAHLLAGQRASGLAARVLGLGAPSLTIFLVDPGQDAELGMDSVSVTVIGGSQEPRRIPDGFPSCAHYELTPGVSGLSCRRAESHSLPREPREQRRSLLEQRVRWMATLSGRSVADVRGAMDARRLVIHEGAVDLAAVAAARRDAVLRAYWSLVRNLVEQGLLPLEEAKRLESTVRIAILDVREKAPTIAVALPDLPPTTIEPDLPD